MRWPWNPILITHVASMLKEKEEGATELQFLQSKKQSDTGFLIYFYLYIKFPYHLLFCQRIRRPVCYKFIFLYVFKNVL